MSQLNYLGGLKKEFHHIKLGTESGSDYEPAMVILKEQLKGRSFIIPLGAMWKYLDPALNQDKFAADREEFMKKLTGAGFKRRIAISTELQAAADADIACCLMAEAFAKGFGLMLSTGWNLAKIMQMMEITPNPQSASQLLMWIQDGLDTLKNMPPCPEDDVLGVAGEATIFADGKKLGTKDMTITETDLAEEATLQ